MTSKDNRPGDAAQLRRQAVEKIVREKEAQSWEDPETLSPEEIRRLIHELRVHQVELEMQNEELLRAQGELDASRVRYFGLYDLAPVGYCTISEMGLILEANLTAATLLGVTRGALVKQPFARFIIKEDQDTYYLRRKQLSETGQPQVCEVRLMKIDGASFWARMEATAAHDTDGAPVCRVVLSDITERKREEEASYHKAALLEAQLASSIDGILVVDAHGKKILQNQRNVELWKIPQHIADNNDDETQVQHVMHMTKNPEQFLEKVVHLYKNPYESSRDEVELTDGTVFDRYSAPIIGKDGQNFGRIWTFRDITERRRVEEALRETEKKLQATLDATPFPVAVVDLHDNKIFYWSRSARRLFGHTAPTTEEWYQIAYPDPHYREQVIERWKPFLDLARKSGLPVNTGEYRVTCRDGSVRICELFATFLPDHLIVTFNDITERRRSETLQQANQERTKAILAGIADTFYSLDDQWRFTMVNPAAEKAPFGRPAYELIGNVIWDLYPNIVDTDIHEHYINAAKNYSLEHYQAQSPLNGRWYEVFMQGWHGGVDVYMRDITERKQTEETLRESEDKFRQVFDSSPIAKSITYVSGEMQANNAFYQMLGYSPGEFRNLNWQDVTHPDDAELSQNIVDSILSGEKDFCRFTKRYIHKKRLYCMGGCKHKATKRR